MKYTIKHALITCIGFAIFSLCLPWFTAATVLSINGFQIALTLGNLLASIGNINSILSLASGFGSYFGSASALPTADLIKMYLIVFLLAAAFIVTFVSLFLSIFGKSKKISVAILVMQAYSALVGLVFIIGLNYLANAINNVAAYGMSAGSYIYFAAALAGTIVSVLIVKRYVDSEATVVKGNPSQSGILCLAGEYLGVSVPLGDQESITIGRDATCCNLVLSGDKISRKHCIITYVKSSGIYRVVDCSINGVFLKNGSRLERDKVQEFTPGAILMLGDKQNVFRLQ